MNWKKIFYLTIFILFSPTPPLLGENLTDNLTARPLPIIIALAGLSLLPLLFVTLTSFAKISIVLSLLRNAIGTPQVPPTSVITGFSLILTLYVMSPLWSEIEKNWQPLLKKESKEELLSKATVEVVIEAISLAKEPYRKFLKAHSSPKNVNIFYNLAKKKQKDEVKKDDFLVLIPSFIVTELSEAFIIGFILYLPFLIIDIVVSNLLLALGMHMLSPTTISLPFKLLLFVMADGWQLIAHGLVTNYS